MPRPTRQSASCPSRAAGPDRRPGHVRKRVSGARRSASSPSQCGFVSRSARKWSAFIDRIVEVGAQTRSGPEAQPSGRSASASGIAPHTRARGIPARPRRPRATASPGAADGAEEIPSRLARSSPRRALATGRRWSTIRPTWSRLDEHLGDVPLEGWRRAFAAARAPGCRRSR